MNLLTENKFTESEYDQADKCFCIDNNWYAFHKFKKNMIV